MAFAAPRAARQQQQHEQLVLVDEHGGRPAAAGQGKRR